MTPVCLSCPTPSVDDAMFCVGCGDRLRLRCTGCDSWHDSGLAFCPVCGLATDVGPEPEPVQLERTTVTVLFADLVGFTAMAERMDPAEVHAVQSAFFERARQVSDRHGAVIEKYIGDAVVMVFGAPRARKNDPLLAIRTGIELHGALRDGPWVGGEHCRLRIGIATGPAVLDLAALRIRSRPLVTGDVLNVAARLQALAPPSGVLVDAATAAGAPRWPLYGPVHELLVQGRTAPVRSRLVRGLSEASGPEPADDGSLSPFTARTVELDTLAAIVDECVRGNRSRLVRVTGAAGIGKTRLLTELRRRRSDVSGIPVRWLSASCQQDGRSIGLSVLCQLIGQELGVGQATTLEQTRRRLRESAQELVAEDSVKLTVQALAPIFGLPSADTLSQDERAGLWRRYLLALAEQLPTVLVVEDIDRAPSIVLSFLRELVAAGRRTPLLVLLTSSADQQPQPAVTQPEDERLLALSPLDPSAIEQLVQAICPTSQLSEQTRRELIARAGGLPMFIEQYVELLTQHGPDSAEQVDVPADLPALVAERVAQLGTLDRRVLMTGSAIGYQFRPVGIAELTGLPVERVLASLEVLGACRLVAPTMPGEPTDPWREWGFSHDLTCQLAYRRYDQTDLADLHDRTADWLLRSWAYPVDASERVAAHRVAALAAARATGQPDTELAGRAFDALRAAVQRCGSLYAERTALGFAQQAVAISDGMDPRRRSSAQLDLLELQLRVEPAVTAAGPARSQLCALADELERLGEHIASVRAWMVAGQVEAVRGRYNPAVRHLDRAVGLAASLPDSATTAQATAELARVQMLGADNEAAMASARRAQRVARRLGLTEVEANARVTAATARYRAGHADGVEALERSVDFCRAQRVLVLRRALNNLGSALLDEGELPRANQCVDASIQVGRVAGINLTAGTLMAAVRAFDRGDWTGLVSASEEFLRAMPRPDSPWELQLRALTAWVRALRGEQTEIDAVQLAAEAQRSGFPQIQRSVLAHLAGYQWVRGETDSAVQLLDQLAAVWARDSQQTASRDWLPGTAMLTSLCGARRSAALSDWLQQLPRHTRWTQAATAALSAGLIEGDKPQDALDRAQCYQDAADVYRQIGALSEAVMAEMVAARLLSGNGAAEAAAPLLAGINEFARRNNAWLMLRVIEAPGPVPLTLADRLPRG